MKRRFPLILGGVALLFPLATLADCGLQYTACEKVCNLKHLGDEAGNAGCVSKCIAERGVCLAKSGADKTAEAGEKAWKNTKSFFKGLTD